MRDDTITVRGPFEVPDLYIEEYTDEDGTLVPTHTLDMSHVRRVEFESRACGCGRLHGYVLEINWDMILSWPQFAEHALESGMQALVRSIEDCQAVEAIAQEADPS
jgi:hypothetical protein